MADEPDNNPMLRARGAALLAQARGRAAEVQRAISAVGVDGDTRAQLEAAGASLSGVEQSLSQALDSPHFPLSGSDLVQMGSVVSAPAVAALVAEATAKAGMTAQQAQVLTAADAATKATVSRLGDDLFTRHIFDKFLTFDSAADEEAYRAREAERQRYVAEQQAKNTPQGNLNAAGGEAGQMLDAHDHGAGNSPEWQTRWDELTQTIHRQRAAMQAAGQSTEEFDRNVQKDVRRFLKEKGLSDAEIDARLAASADPLDAVKPYLGTDKGSRVLEEKLRATPAATLAITERDDAAKPEEIAQPQAAQSSPAHLDALAAAAQLSSLGIAVSESDEPTHGLSYKGPAPEAGRGGNSPT